MKYLVRTPWWIRKLYGAYTWRMPSTEKQLYLSFDDGPHESATPFVLDTLKRFGAKATFFCIGKNVVAHPEIYQRILSEGHSVGNHTQHHLNGWSTPDRQYLSDVAEASKHIASPLFRPPYGRIRRFQAKHIPAAMQQPAAKVIMWEVLSGDFDPDITNERCLQNVVLNARKGSIIVFHDSAKAFPTLEYVLPQVLTYFSERRYQFEAIPMDIPALIV